MKRELEIAFPFYEKGMEMEFSNRKGNLMLLFPGMAGNGNGNYINTFYFH